ncbi:hypothetical protein GDO78_011230 [Eleutherodactylus coqui]|uniref:Uncharacterized protein n=1 Tax=Eleutherodactylus coqui TaxID=57060 RepID=A0A8J6F996_ELECQ|nr:hypothetical protein GDO78_011230 [Eleutherodactylus coqui]
MFLALPPCKRCTLSSSMVLLSGRCSNLLKMVVTWSYKSSGGMSSGSPLSLRLLRWPLFSMSSTWKVNSLICFSNESAIC